MGQNNRQSAEAASGSNVFSGEDAIKYLMQMGLSVQVLRDGLIAGDAQAANATSFAPKTAAGTLRWLTTVEVCRRNITTEHGWHQDDTQNRPTSVARSGMFTLSFVGGDLATGMLAAFPKAARSKGAATEASVQENALFPMSAINRDQKAIPMDQAGLIPGNWVLLYHKDEEGIRWEVSLPSGFTRGQFTGWTVRLIMQPITGEAVTDIPGSGGDDVEFWIE